VDTTEDQQRLIAVAQASGSAGDYAAYLSKYPDGIFAEFAAFELKVLAEKAERETAGTGDTLVAAATPTRAAPPAAGTEVTFTLPLQSNVEVLMGKSIEQIINLSPLYAPIEGIPEELWKNQTCSNCHQWTKEAMCTQAETYLNASEDQMTFKQHPFGGDFKLNLRAWAGGGCK
jgi:hypothetical protein